MAEVDEADLPQLLNAGSLGEGESRWRREEGWTNEIGRPSTKLE